MKWAEERRYKEEEAAAAAAEEGELGMASKQTSVNCFLSLNILVMNLTWWLLYIVVTYLTFVYLSSIRKLSHHLSLLFSFLFSARNLTRAWQASQLWARHYCNSSRRLFRFNAKLRVVGFLYWRFRLSRRCCCRCCYSCRCLCLCLCWRRARANLESRCDCSSYMATTITATTRSLPTELVRSHTLCVLGKLCQKFKEICVQNIACLSSLPFAVTSLGNLLPSRPPSVWLFIKASYSSLALMRHQVEIQNKIPAWIFWSPSTSLWSRLAVG